MTNERDQQPTSWGTTRPGPLENDDLVAGGAGAEGRADSQGGLRSDNMLNADRGTTDADLAAQTLGLDENDDMDVPVDEYTDLDFDDNDILDSDDVVSEGGALDQDGTRNVYAVGETGAGGTMDDDETMGPDARQPDRMALDRTPITRADLEPRKGSLREDVGTTYNTMHARTTAASESERLPGEDQLNSFAEHEEVVGSFTGIADGEEFSAGVSSDITPDSTMGTQRSARNEEETAMGNKGNPNEKPTDDETKQRVNEADKVLPGDKARAQGERGKTDDEDALDSGTSDSTTVGGFSDSSGGRK